MWKAVSAVGPEACCNGMVRLVELTTWSFAVVKKQKQKTRTLSKCDKRETVRLHRCMFLCVSVCARARVNMQKVHGIHRVWRRLQHQCCCTPI